MMTGLMTHSSQFSGADGEGTVTLDDSEAQFLGAAEEPHERQRNPVNARNNMFLRGVTQSWVYIFLMSTFLLVGLLWAVLLSGLSCPLLAMAGKGVSTLRG